VQTSKRDLPWATALRAGGECSKRLTAGSSWLNLIERWFGELTNKAIRRGSFSGVGDLVIAIHEFLDATNNDPTVYVWTASAEAIMEKVARCQAILQTEH
jgi:hypothetical protein